MTLKKPGRPHNEELTLKVYQAAVAYWQHYGIPPSLLDIAVMVGTSKSNARYHLFNLVERKWIEIVPGISRGIVVVGAKWFPPDGRTK